jgi:hypothetical protein
MRVSKFRWMFGVVAVCVYAWLALAQPLLVRADDPICIDPKTKKPIPCPPTDVPNGGNTQPGPETNGRICLAAFNDLNFNSLQDSGEPFLTGGQVQVTNLATGAVSLVDLLADGPNCQFLPGGADYTGTETPPSGFAIIGSGTFNTHLDTSGTVQILFANTNSAPSATATLKLVIPATTAVKAQTATPTATASLTSTAVATATPTATNTATLIPSNTPTSTQTPVAPAAIISGNPPAAVQPTQPPPPAPITESQPVSACSPWLIGAGLGLLTAGISLVGLVRPARRGGKANQQPEPNIDSSANDPAPESDDSFEYSQSPAQQRTQNLAFTSKSPQRPNDHLRSAGPSPKGVNGSAYQLSLAGVPNQGARIPLWLTFGLFSILAMGGLALAAIGVAGVAGAVACGQWQVGAIVGAIAVVAALIADGLDVRYTMFLPEGTPTRATVSLKLKQSSGPTGPKLESSSGHQSTGNSGMTSKQTDKTNAANNSTRDSDRQGNQTQPTSGQNDSTSDPDKLGRH